MGTVGRKDSAAGMVDVAAEEGGGSDCWEGGDYCSDDVRVGDTWDSGNRERRT